MQVTEKEQMKFLPLYEKQTSHPILPTRIDLHNQSQMVYKLSQQNVAEVSIGISIE